MDRSSLFWGDLQALRFEVLGFKKNAGGIVMQFVWEIDGVGTRRLMLEIHDGHTIPMGNKRVTSPLHHLNHSSTIVRKPA